MCHIIAFNTPATDALIHAIHLNFVREMLLELENGKIILFSLVFMVDYIINLISESNHKCEKMKYHFSYFVIT